MAFGEEWFGRVGEAEEERPVDLQTDRAHSARMYDYWLGGKTNFGPDREMSAAFEQAIPTIRLMARENRRFLGRAVRHMVVEQGIRQFLDIGTGIPTEGNTHEVAQAVAPDARVVYVDNDPIVLAHARALMDGGTGDGRTAYLHADLREPEAILADPVLAETLDLRKPVGLTLVAVLMLFRDAEDPWGLARTLMEALPSGSCAAVTHPGLDFDPVGLSGAAAAAEQGGMTLVPRERDAVARFFGGWEPVEPGVVPVMAWRPDGGEPEDPAAAYYWAGVARKP